MKMIYPREEHEPEAESNRDVWYCQSTRIFTDLGCHSEHYRQASGFPTYKYEGMKVSAMFKGIPYSMQPYTFFC